MDWEPTPETCPLHHQVFELTLGLVVTIGLVLSYLPQHYRIIKTGSSDGLSPLFLLLGGASSSASLVCVVLLQWRVIRCRSVWPLAQSLESLVGIMQVGLQWLMFSIIIVLFIFYYPPDCKYSTLTTDSSSETQPLLRRARSRRKQYTLAWASVWTFVLHLMLILVVSIVLLTGASSPPKIIPGPPIVPPPLPPSPPRYPGSASIAFVATTASNNLGRWTALLGLWAAILGSFQYLPQIFTTLRKGQVGALSIPTMAIQCPGSFVFVASLAGRPGVDWTGWVTYAVTGVLQGILLVICIVLQRRHANLVADASTERQDESTAPNAEHADVSS